MLEKYCKQLIFRENEKNIAEKELVNYISFENVSRSVLNRQCEDAVDEQAVRVRVLAGVDSSSTLYFHSASLPPGQGVNGFQQI